MNEKKRLKERKVFNELSHVVNRINKGDTCCLCGKKVTSFCNSHEVPKYILKEIAEDGKIYWGQNISDREDVFNTKRGIKNAFTFK